MKIYIGNRNQLIYTSVLINTIKMLSLLINMFVISIFMEVISGVNDLILIMYTGLMLHYI